MRKNWPFIRFSVTMLLLFTIINIANAQRPVKKRPTKTARSSYTGRDTLERKTVLEACPTNFFATTMKLSIETKLSSNKGLKILASYGQASPGGDASGSFYGLWQFSEFGFETQFRIYVLKDRPALNGLYLAPYFGYKSMNYQASLTNPFNNNTPYAGPSSTISDFSFGYIIGYQYIFSSTFTFDVFIGGGDNQISGDNSQGLLNGAFAYPKGIMVHMGLGIGIAF
jgi:hypothetical protein